MCGSASNHRQKTKRYARRKMADRFMALFGPEPWTVYAPGKNADDLACCDGYDCGCGAMTYREESEAKRKDQPAIEYLRLSCRTVTPWSPVEDGK